MKKPAIAIVLLLAALVAVQTALDAMSEKREEDRLILLGKPEASKALPQYISSLFLGAFRAVAIDILWVELRRMRDQEHRFYETVEIMEMITTLQPRNAEVWAYQGHDAAYNIAENVRNPEDRWKYMRRGFLTWHQGTRNLPDDPYLKYQIGLSLLKKGAPDLGVFDIALARRFENDREIQETIGRSTGGPPKSVFEMAIEWFALAGEDLRRFKKEQRWRFYRTSGLSQAEPRDYHTTQMGLNILPSSMAGFVYHAMSHQAFYLWEQERSAEAAEWFRRAARQAREVLEKYPDMRIYDDFGAMSERCAELAIRPVQTPEQQLEMIRALTEQALRTMVDDRYVANRVARMRRALGGDEHEFNDDPSYYGTRLEFERIAEGNLAPAGDRDAFLAIVNLPRRPRRDHDHDGPEEERKLPYRMGFQVKKEGDTDLRVTLLVLKEGDLREAGSLEVRGPLWEEIEGIAEAPGVAAVVIEPLGGAPGRDSRFLVRWSLSRPQE